MKLDAAGWKKYRALRAQQLREARIRLAFWHKRKREIEVINNE